MIASRPSPPRAPTSTNLIEAIAAGTLAATFGLIQLLIGGTRLVFSLPAYGLLAGIALLALFSLRRAKPAPGQLCLIGVAAFFGYVIVRALFSPVPYLARTDLYSILAGLIVYLFVALVLVDAKPRIAILCFLLVLGTVHAFVGAIQFRDGNNFMLVPFLQRFDYGRRASGFYICPNHLAGLLEVIGIFGLSLTCWSRCPTWMKLLIAYCVAICYAGSILTGSRGGYLSAGASLLVFATLSLAVLRKAGAGLFWKLGGIGMLAAIFAAAAIVFFVSKSDVISSRAHNVMDDKDVRFDFWQAAVSQWKLAPMFGTGSGTYLFYGRQFRTDRMQLDPIYVHNDYLQLLAEYGIIGAAGFLLFLGAHLSHGLQEFRRLGPKRVAISARLLSNNLALTIGAIASVAAYVVHSVVDFNLHIPANVLLLAFVFGILANARTAREGSSSVVPRFALGWRLVIPVLGLMLAIQCWRLWPGERSAELSRIALRDGRSSDAILHALRGLEQEKWNTDLYYYLGRARTLEGDAMNDPRARDSFYRAALAAFEDGRRLAGHDETFSIELGLAYDELGRFSEAEWMFDEATALDPRSMDVKAYYAAHLERWRVGKAAEAPAASD